MERYTDINSRMIDRRAENGWEWAIPVSHETYAEALNGEIRLFLTPTKPVPLSWLGDLRKKKVLALAAGGGQQGPLLAASKATVTVFDNSKRMLELDGMVAQREGYEIELIKGDMTEALPFPDEHFDLIINPVSNCYIEDMSHLWKECWRVLKPGARLLAGLDNGMNFIVDDDEERIIHPLPFNPLRNPEQLAQLTEDEGIQFSHSYEDNLQTMLDAGFTLKGIFSDTNSNGRLKDLGIPSFYAVNSMKI